MSNPWWKGKGFSAGPRELCTSHRETWYRVHGGRSRPFGPDLSEAWFLTLRPESVTQADMFANIIIWGNGCWVVEHIEVPLGIWYFQGPVEHNEHFGNVPEWVIRHVWQTFLEMPWANGLRPIARTALRQDAFAGRPSQFVAKHPGDWH